MSEGESEVCDSEGICDDGLKCCCLELPVLSMDVSGFCADEATYLSEERAEGRLSPPWVLPETHFGTNKAARLLRTH